jgi:hypothetical protein
MEYRVTDYDRECYEGVSNDDLQAQYKWACARYEKLSQDQNHYLNQRMLDAVTNTRNLCRALLKERLADKFEL